MWHDVNLLVLFCYLNKPHVSAKEEPQKDCSPVDMSNWFPFEMRTSLGKDFFFSKGTILLCFLTIVVDSSWSTWIRSAGCSFSCEWPWRLNTQMYFPPSQLDTPFPVHWTRCSAGVNWYSITEVNGTITIYPSWRSGPMFLDSGTSAWKIFIAGSNKISRIVSCTGIKPCFQQGLE